MYSDPRMGIDWKAFAGYLVAAALVASAGGGLYGAGVVSAPALYGFVFLAIAIAGVGFLRWEERDHRDRQRQRHGPQT